MSANVEPVDAFDSVSISIGDRRSWSGLFRKLVGAFGLGLSKAPRRPQIPHPVDRLIFHNFAIYEIYRGQPGRQYMSLTDVEVVRKLSFRELGDVRCEYRFELNVSPDPIWQCFFKRFSKEMAVRLENRAMVLCCLPSELEAHYEQIRNAVASANAWHAEDREELLANISAQIEALQAAQEMERNRRFGLQQQFDGLDI